MVSTFRAFIFQNSLRITYSVNRKVHIKNEFDTKLKHVIFSRDAFSEFYQSDSRSSSFQNNWPTTVTLQGTDRKEWWVTLGTRIVLFEFVLYLDTFRQQRRRNPGKVGVEWMASFILLYSVIITLAHVWNDARKMTTNSFFRKETSIILWIYVRVVSAPPLLPVDRMRTINLDNGFHKRSHQCVHPVLLPLTHPPLFLFLRAGAFNDYYFFSLFLCLRSLTRFLALPPKLRLISVPGAPGCILLTVMVIPRSLTVSSCGNSKNGKRR